jgi:amino acid adenylation domain-containing protein
VPFEKVVETVVKDRDISRNALFQVMFILQNTPDIPLIQLGETKLSTEVFENKTTKFDLTLVVKEIDDALQGTLSYNTDLFARETVQRMLNHFIEFLSAVVKEPNQEISTISLVTESEKFKLLNEFNKPVGIDVEERNLVALFETQATLTPGNAALICDGKSLSYKLLNELSNQLANFLAGKNVKQGSIVPVCTDRSFEMMIGVLAVLKTGAAYVPVDPEYPAERIAFMLGDTQAATILTSQNYLQKLQKIAEKVELISIDSAWNELVDQQTENLSANITGEDLAYVLYTSGSTGKPKGVPIKHNSIAQHLIWFTKQYQITQADSSYLISSFSFDGAMTAIWPVLVKGGTLHLPVGNVLDPLDVLNYISQHSISYIKTLPGIFRELIHAHNFNDRILCKSVRLIILGGEKISSSDLKTYFSYYPNVIFSNHYGPTECTVSSSFYVINKENIEKFSEQPVVGRPVDYTEIYVLNEAGLLSPIGVPGEICISGLGVAKGYLNNEPLTNEKFVRNPFSENTSSRMYKTGDIGRWHDDGNLEFIGRKDEQVKIRGYRVELGEIEIVLEQSPSVRQAIVLAKEDNYGANNLVAFIVPEGAYDQAGILSFVKSKLPGFMVPGVWLEMEALPLSPNGKVDRKALPEPNFSGQAKSKFQAPTNKTEQAIANIWQELLKVDQVGVYDNFFEIGGHSLLAMRVVSSIRKQLQVELTIKSLFLFPTIEGLAKHIQSHGQAVLLPVIKVQQRPERIPLSFSQERLWFIDRFDGSSQYHISAVLRLKGELNKEALQFALQNVVNRHEVLRTVIQEHEGQGYQYILQKDQFQIHCIDDKIYTEDRDGLQSIYSN